MDSVRMDFSLDFLWNPEFILETHAMTLRDLKFPMAMFDNNIKSCTKRFFAYVKNLSAQLTLLRILSILKRYFNDYYTT